MEDSLKKRYLIKLLANVISAVIGVAFIAIIPKSLGVIAYGQFLYIQQFFLQLVGLLEAGSSTAFFIKLSANNSRKDLITFYFLFSLIIFFLIFIIITIMDYFGYIQNILPNIPNEFIYMGILFGFFTWFSQILIKISDAYALTVSVEFIKILHRISSLLLLLYVVTFLNFNLTIFFYFHYLLLFIFILMTFILFVYKNVLNIKIFDLNLNYKSLINEFVSYSSPLAFYGVISAGVIMFDIWLLQLMGGSEQTAYYGLSYSIISVIIIFVSAIIPLLSRELSKSYANKNLEEMRNLFYKYVPMLYVITAYFGIFVSFQSENILYIFTDEKFLDAFLVLSIMALYPLNQTYGQITSSVFYATEETKLYKNIGLISSSFGLIMTFIFIYILNLGAIGFALKMVIAQIFSVMISLYFNSKLLKLKMSYFIIHQLKVLILFIFSASISSFIFGYLETPLYSFLFSGVLYTLLVFLQIYFFPDILSMTRNQLINNLKNVLTSSNKFMFKIK